MWAVATVAVAAMKMKMAVLSQIQQDADAKGCHLTSSNRFCSLAVRLLLAQPSTSALVRRYTFVFVSVEAVAMKTFTSKSLQIALQLKEFSLLYQTTNPFCCLISLEPCQVLHQIQDSLPEKFL